MSHKPWKKVITGHPAFRVYTFKLKKKKKTQKQKTKRNTSNDLGFLADEAFQESTCFPGKRALPEAEVSEFSFSLALDRVDGQESFPCLKDSS